VSAADDEQEKALAKELAKKKKAEKAAKKRAKELLEAKKHMKKEMERRKYFSKADQLSRLEKYEEADKKNEHNKEFKGDPNFRGPIIKKLKSNLPLIISFLIVNVGFFFYVVFAYKDGAPDRLQKGMDFRSEVCGTDDLESKPYLYFANPVIDINVKFCVEKCPPSSGPLICLYDVDPDRETPFCYV